ncbi:hypothetical protein GCM10027275_35750 [Rhabdobacter roseus]|uniref:Lipoprotein n=1 Tax=Rhabdobacter roseus TaxID=1655419 RepID=A0A840TVA9_9BACT|nr:hypothetical protein [Rhabdobacter roseus]MBB5285203.1 hypothetical protein [Rhabdobacter roseus]
MKKWMLWGSLALLVSVSACTDKDGDVEAFVIVESDFEAGADGWTGQYAEYGTEQGEDIMEFKFARTTLPEPLDTTKRALRIQSHNRSDDVFMYLKRKVTGLDPNRTYSLTMEVDFATNAPEGSVGIGGSPANSVYMKAGASPNEPVKTLDANDFYVVNIDKGQQATGGTEMVVIGDISNGEDEPVYTLVKRNNFTEPVSVKPNTRGEIWLCVGTDSGFEGLTVLYYDRIKATLR